MCCVYLNYVSTFLCRGFCQNHEWSGCLIFSCVFICVEVRCIWQKERQTKLETGFNQKKETDDGSQLSVPRHQSFLSRDP